MLPRSARSADALSGQYPADVLWLLLASEVKPRSHFGTWVGDHRIIYPNGDTSAKAFVSLMTYLKCPWCLDLRGGLRVLKYRRYLKYLKCKVLNRSNKRSLTCSTPILMQSTNASMGDNCRGQFRFSVRCRNFHRDIFLRNFGALPALRASSVAAVARYCCAVVGSQSVCHVWSSCFLGSEKLVVVENVCELGLSGKWSGNLHRWSSSAFSQNVPHRHARVP